MKPALQRRGAWLISQGAQWQMASFEGPVESADPGRQTFQVRTASKEVLLVSRPLGERGMRELRLEQILPASA